MQWDEILFEVAFLFFVFLQDLYWGWPLLENLFAEDGIKTYIEVFTPPNSEIIRVQNVGKKVVNLSGEP